MKGMSNSIYITLAIYSKTMYEQEFKALKCTAVHYTITWA